MSPWFGGMKPEITPIRVVLPAPFGPIKPVIRPSSAAIDTPSTARTPPNRRVRFETSRSGSAKRYLPPPALEAASRSGDEADEAARRKGDDQHQHAAVDDEVETWRIARDVRRRLAERLDHQRAPARPAHRHCAELHLEGTDAERARRVLVLAHGNQPGAEPSALDRPCDDKRDREQPMDDPVEHGAAFELERRRMQVELDQGTDAGAGDRRDAGKDAQHLGEGERHQCKVRASQACAERQRADDRADQRAGCDPDGESWPGINAVAHLEDRSGIGAGAEERGVTERILPAIAAENVPPLAGQRRQQCYDEEIESRVGMHDERHRGEHGDDEENRRNALHAFAPTRPVGRTRSTAMKTMSMPLWPSASPRNSPERLSTTPTMRPPMSAPGTEPMPPSTTVVLA